MINEVVIVGSGPSGVASALGFAENGIVPVILDVGNESRDYQPRDISVYEYRKSPDSFNVMIGENYEGLNNLIHENKIFPKLISPFMQFVIKDVEKLSPIEEKGFVAVQSFAKGGLANAWGAGLYRCVDDELMGLPVNSSDLSPYYDKLTREIGISGDDDDLTTFFGSTTYLLGPLKLSRKSEVLYLKYKRNKKKLNDRGVYIGRPRLCALSQSYNNRTECKYHNLESWFPNQPCIYTPTFTLQRLIKENKVIYHNSLLVKKWIRAGKYIIVIAENVNSGTEVAFKCKTLILAAGTINSAKIVLNSKNDFKTKLPLFDNALVQIPLIFPKFIGSKFDSQVLGLPNLDMIVDLKKINLKLKGSIIELAFPARSFFNEMLPFSAKDNLVFLKMFLPSLMVLLLYFPSSSRNIGYLMLHSDKKLEAYSRPYYIDKYIIKEVVNTFLRLGVLTHSSLMQKAQPGYAIHYAGTLPMVENPKQDYQCNKAGELYDEPDVYITDGSLFSYIPAKNISFTFMANAMRIADNISKVIHRR